jgi:hypothetical protein
VVLRSVDLESRKLLRRHPQDGTGSQVLLNRGAMSPGQRVYLCLASVNNHVDGWGVRRELVDEIGAQACGLTDRRIRPQEQQRKRTV